MPREARVPWWNKLAHSRLFLLIAAGLVLFLLVSFVREVVHRYEINQEISNLESQINDLESRQQTLTGLLDYFSSPLFQEQEARQKLGKAKPGESVVIIPLEDDETPTLDGKVNATAQADEGGALPNPVKWWRYFFSS